MPLWKLLCHFLVTDDRCSFSEVLCEMFTLFKPFLVLGLNAIDFSVRTLMLINKTIHPETSTLFA